MKSSSVSSMRFSEYAKMAEDFGADMIYIVDSAGSMLPKELEKYILNLKSKIQIPFGFHGHDNIGMANANSILAYEYGALHVDTTILGVGRGSGNASTETVISILQDKYNQLNSINVNNILHVAKKKIEKLLDLQKSKTLSEAFGLANVHTMYMKKILTFSQFKKVDIFKLVKAIGKIDTVNCDETIINKAYENIKEENDSNEINRLVELKFYEN